MAHDVLEARIDSKGGTETGPDSEDGVVSFGGLGCVGGGDCLESKAEISCEAVSGAKVRSCQCRPGCGYCVLKWERKASSVSSWRREASSAMQFASPGRYCAR